jgi:hypothetical protein
VTVWTDQAAPENDPEDAGQNRIIGGSPMWMLQALPAPS